MPHDALKGQLEERLATLQARLSRLKLDATRGHPTDSEEQAQDRENDEVVDAIGNETTLLIEVILGALRRIENGVYGTCDNCGKSIAIGRLKAMPEATRCLACAS
jgi:DnaK suppressor protein